MSNKRYRSVGLKLVTISVAVIVLIVLGFCFLFDINEIVVEGASEYSSDEIIIASGIKTGTNLWLFNKSKAEKKIAEAYTYISNVTIIRELPDTVRIKVSESVIKAVVEFETKRYILDEDCRVIEEAEYNGNYIKISGLDILNAEKGSIIQVEDGEKTNLRFAQTVLKHLGDCGYGDDVTWLDVTNISNITFDFMGRFTVKVGSGENLEYKLSRLDGIVSQLGSTDRGIIDISEAGKSFFTPED